MTTTPATLSKTCRNLVIVRAGRNSLHRRWIEGARQRNWDLLVSYYDKAAADNHDPAEGQADFVAGGKWDGLYKTILQTGVLERYDRFWLPDDDIDANSSGIDRLFDMARQHGFGVCQPSLTLDSHYTYFTLLQCPGMRLRYVNFVEIMVPCLTAERLAAILPECETSMSGFGLDFIWHRLNRDNRYDAAVIDAIAVHHTRPVGSVLSKAMAGVGKNPFAERDDMAARYGFDVEQSVLAYAGITARGRRIEGEVRMGIRQMLGYASAIPRFHSAYRMVRKSINIFEEHWAHRVDLSQIGPVRPARRGPVDAAGAAHG